MGGFAAKIAIHGAAKQLVVKPLLAPEHAV
jgi:hypothetical protein